MGKSQRDKGARAERELVKLFTAADIPAKRVPLSGADANFKGDLYLNPWNRGSHRPDLVLEAKVRGNGFRSIYSWIEGNDLLAIKADRREWLIVQPLEQYIKIMNGEAI